MSVPKPDDKPKFEHSSDLPTNAGPVPDDVLASAAGDAAARARLARDDPEPSLGSRLARIGILGWMIVTPILLSALAGRWLDTKLGSGVMFAAAFLTLGAAFGLWLAWRWMHEQ